MRAVTLLLLLAVGCGPGDWRTASRETAGIAPDPASTPEAVLQVYGAPARGWRGWFAVHTWIATKGAGETAYTVCEVVGWQQRRGQSVVRITRIGTGSVSAPNCCWTAAGRAWKS